MKRLAGVGGELHTGAHFTQLWRLLDHLDIGEALALECQGGGKATDAGARDEDGLVFAIHVRAQARVEPAA